MLNSLSTGNQVTETGALRSAPIEDDEIDLLALLGTLWRGKTTILGCALAAMLLAGYYAFQVAVPKYSATTTLVLQLRSENIVDLESVISGVSTEAAAINTELEVMRSSSLLEQLVQRLDLTSDPEFNGALQEPSGVSLDTIKAFVRTRVAPPPAPDIDTPAEAGTDNAQLLGTIGALRSAISVSNQRNTYVFQISAKTTAPRKSALIANTLADIYIQDQIDQKFNATENAVAWLSERVVELEADLAVRQDQIKALRAETSIISEEGLLALNQQSRDLRDRLSQTQAAMATQQARIGLLQDHLENRRYTEIAELANDPTLRRLLNTVNTGDANAIRLFTDRFDLLLGREQLGLERSTQQASALQASFDQLTEQIARQSEGFEDLQQLVRETDAVQTLYETFLARLKETTIQRGLQQADSRVLSAAPPGTYAEPAKTRILLLGIILGGMIGVGIVMIRQMLHSGFRDPEALESATGLAVLGQIPKIPISKRQDLIGYLTDKPTSAAAEAVRNLRTSVLLSNIDQTPQVIMSTSSVPKEGKTTQSVALAHNLAGLGKKVLLLEADIRRRTFAEYFDFGTSQGGLVSVLSGSTSIQNAVVTDPRMKADVLRGEKTQVNAADLFSSDRFREFITEMRSVYDFIVIDTPPVLVVPDSRIIAQHADVVVFSVAWDRTSRAQVSEALRQFTSVGIRVNGLILSQIDPKGMKRYGYGGKYGAYSSYGRGYYDVT